MERCQGVFKQLRCKDSRNYHRCTDNQKILGLHLAKTALDIIGTYISKSIAGSLASRLGVEIAANEGISAVLSTALSKK